MIPWAWSEIRWAATVTDHGLCTTVKWEQRGQNPLKSTLVLQLQRVLEKKWNTGHFNVPISDHRWRLWELETQHSACVSICQIMYKLLKWKICFSVRVMLVRLLNHCDSTPVPSHVDWLCVRWHRGVVQRINNTQMILKKDREGESGNKSLLYLVVFSHRTWRNVHKVTCKEKSVGYQIKKPLVPKLINILLQLARRFLHMQDIYGAYEFGGWSLLYLHYHYVTVLLFIGFNSLLNHTYQGQSFVCQALLVFILNFK